LIDAKNVDEAKAPLSALPSTRAAVWQDQAKRLPTGKIWRLNHYYTRSRTEFEQRFSRGRVDPDAYNRGRRVDLLEQETVRDETILRFFPALRRRLDPGATSR
jgi:hypothetical protein